MYRLFGPLSMLFILIIFVVGLVRLVGTLLIRAVVITKEERLVVYGCLPPCGAPCISWSSHPSGGADSTAEQMARDVEMRMEPRSRRTIYLPLRRKLDQARDEAKPLYKMAQAFFRKGWSAASAPPGEIDGTGLEDKNSRD